jgi:hypothetical protein
MPTADAYVAMVNVAPELTSGRTRHGAKIRCDLRFSKASINVGVITIFCGWDFLNKSVSITDRSLKG